MQPTVEYMRMEALVSGDVQGVGFRWFTRSRALALGLRGYARNLPDLRVEVVAEGPRGALDRLLEALRRGPEDGEVSDVRVMWSPAEGDFVGFSIR